MASETVVYKLALETGNFSSNAKKAERDFAAIGTTATGTTRKFAGFADALGKTSTTLARSASLFGLNAQSLRAMDDAADVAELGLKNLSKSMVGLNAATLGVAAAGFSLGYAIGGLARTHLPGLAKAADEAAASLLRLFTAQDQLDRQQLGKMSQKDFMATIADREARGRQMRFDHMKGLGMSPDQMKVQLGFEKAKDPMLAKIEAFEQMLKKADAAARKAAQGIGGTAIAVKTLADRMSDAVGAGNPFADMLGDQRSDAEKFEDYFKSLPGFDPGNGIPGGGNPFDPGPMPGVPSSGGGFGSRFGQQMMNLPQAILGAFQGGGSITKSLGGFFGGAGGSALSGGIGKLLGSKAIGSALGSVLPGIGTLLGGLAGGLVGKLFGGGKSKEQIAAEKQQAEQQRQRIQEGARAMRTQSIDQLGGAASSFFMSRTIATPEDAKRSGTLFIDAWTQVVKEKGVLAAADAFGGAFDKMKADMEQHGIAMPEWMQAISGQMGLSKNEGFRAAAGNAQNAAGFLGALGGAGGLSPESFRAFEQEARASFAAAQGAATEAGMETAEATRAGFSATSPLLKGLLNESMVTGQTLSADIQAMVDQAGITADIDVQQLDELRQIRAAIQSMAGSGGGAVGPAGGTFAGGGGGGGADFGNPGGDYPAFASGGNVTKTGMALVHAGEQVLRPGASTGTTVNANITIQASGNAATDKMLAERVSVEIGKLIRGGKGRQLTSALKDDGFARKGAR